jgi:hypothetical protein
MGFAQELKDFTAGYQAGHGMAVDAQKARTEWEKTRPINEKDIAGQPDEPTGSATVPSVDDPNGTGGGSYDYSDINI